MRKYRVRKIRNQSSKEREMIKQKVVYFEKIILFQIAI